jgi:hypothetical protein
MEASGKSTDNVVTKSSRKSAATISFDRDRRSQLILPSFFRQSHLTFHAHPAGVGIQMDH